MKSKEEIANKHGILSGKHSEFDDAILNAMQEYATQCKYDMANEIEYLKKEIEKIDTKYTEEFDYWQEKAKEMTNKYNDLINKQK
jgi:lipoate-protein ligase A